SPMIESGADPLRGGDVSPRLYSFVGGVSGAWSVDRITTVAGEGLPLVSRLDVIHGQIGRLPPETGWILRGVTSNVRYVVRAEQRALLAKQAAPGRREGTGPALTPIKKSSAWWDLPQDERRRIFEESSHHIATGLKYLPAIARRLHHCRDLGESEPFD